MDGYFVITFLQYLFRISFATTSFWDDERCKTSCRSVAITKMHLLSDDKIISELLTSSKQCFAYSNMSSVSRFLLSEFFRILLWKLIGIFERSDFRETVFLWSARIQGVEFETIRKERFECILVNIFLFIVRYFFVVCIRSSKSAVFQVFIISLSAIFYTIDDILIFQ